MNSNLEKKEVLAGIVTYNPETELLRKNIEALKDQVSEILIVDNNSQNVSDVNDLADDYGIHVITNYENNGLAPALNQILEYAKENEYPWYLSMDQDSIVSGNLIEGFSAHTGKQVGILCPYLLNNNKTSLEEFRSLNLPETEVIADPIDCITSAALNRTEAVNKVGGYDERLFIDCIDVDLNIRLMNEGYEIRRVNETYLLQQMGEGKEISFFKFLNRLTGLSVFRKLSVSPVYSDIRIYYISRNSAYIRNRYKEKAGRRMSRKWMNAQFIYYLLTYPLSRSRKKMIAAWKSGQKDAARLLEDESCS